MPTYDWEELRKRVLDRYDIEELVTVMDLTVEDLVDKFYDTILEMQENEELDV